MIELVVFLLAVIGMAHIMVDGTIFVPFKAWLAAEKSPDILMDFFINIGFIKWSRAKLLALMNCYQCSGFWSGVAIGALAWYIHHDPLHVSLGWGLAAALFCYGCAGSFVSTFAAVILMWIQAKLGN